MLPSTSCCEIKRFEQESAKKCLMTENPSFTTLCFQGPFVYFGNSFYASNSIPVSSWSLSNEIVEVDPLALLSLNRIDLAAKIRLAKHLLGTLKDNSAVTRCVETENVIKNHSSTELGSEDKQSVEDYVRSYWNKICSIRTRGYNAVIPVSKSGTPLTGSHGLAASIALNLPKVPVVFTDLPDKIYDSDFFLKRGLSPRTIDKLVLDHVIFSKDASVFLSWPRNSNTDRQRMQSFVYAQAKRGVAKLSLKVSRKGFQGVALNVYESEDWIGSPLNRYVGARKKASQVGGLFLGHKSLHIYVTDNVDQANLNEGLKGILKGGKDAFFLSDSTEKATALLRVLLNKNSKMLFSRGDPLRYKSNLIRIKELREQPNSETALIESSTVLGLHGLRKPNDLDFISYSTNLAESKFESNIQCHNKGYFETLNHDWESLRLLIEDESNHFVFHRMKFLSLEGLISNNKRSRSWLKKIDILLVRGIEAKFAVKGPLIFVAFFISKIRVAFSPIANFLVKNVPDEIQNILRKILN